MFSLILTQWLYSVHCIINFINECFFVLCLIISILYNEIMRQTPLRIPQAVNSKHAIVWLAETQSS